MEPHRDREHPLYPPLIKCRCPCQQEMRTKGVLLRNSLKKKSKIRSKTSRVVVTQHFKMYFVHFVTFMNYGRDIGTETTVVLYISWADFYLHTHTFSNDEREVNNKQSTLFY